MDKLSDREKLACKNIAEASSLDTIVDELRDAYVDYAIIYGDNTEEEAQEIWKKHHDHIRGNIESIYGYLRDYYVEATEHYAAFLKVMRIYELRAGGPRSEGFGIDPYGNGRNPFE